LVTDLGNISRKVVGWGSLVVAIAALKFASGTGHPVIVHAGELAIYRFNVGMVVLTAVACLAILICALAIATAKIGLLRIAALVPAAMAVLLALVTIDTIHSHVTVGPQYVEVPQMGLWNRPHSQFKYDDLAAVVHDPKERNLHFIRKNGEAITVPRGDLSTAALPAIVNALREHNVHFVDDNASPAAD
jgi:hypothetical protein